MSGHSKWHSIRHKKGANDLARGKVLTKHSKILMVVGRENPIPETNPALRTAISNAKSDGVPKSNIERVLKKLSGSDKNTTQFSQQCYEGYAPLGIPILIEALTDNPNRTFPQLRTAIEKGGGKMGSAGSVKFLFDRIGIILVETADLSEEDLFEMVMEAGGDDLHFGDDETTVITTFDHLGLTRSRLEKKLKIIKSEARYIAKDPVSLAPDDREKIENFVEKIEAVDDVDDVFVGYV